MKFIIIVSLLVSIISASGFMINLNLQRTRKFHYQKIVVRKSNKFVNNFMQLLNKRSFGGRRR